MRFKNKKRLRKLFFFSVPIFLFFLFLGVYRWQIYSRLQKIEIELYDNRGQNVTEMYKNKDFLFSYFPGETDTRRFYSSYTPINYNSRKNTFEMLVSKYSYSSLSTCEFTLERINIPDLKVLYKKKEDSDLFDFLDLESENRISRKGKKYLMRIDIGN